MGNLLKAYPFSFPYVTNVTAGGESTTEICSIK